MSSSENSLRVEHMSQSHVTYLLMRKILYEEQSASAIRKYIFDYKKYFRDLYTDTGLFSEDILLEKYEQEARMRHREILDRIEERLSPDIVHGRTPQDTLFLSWRSKVLYIEWRDE